MSFVKFDNDTIISTYDKESNLSKENEKYWKSVTEEILKQKKQIYLGGGIENINKQHNKGR